MEWLSQCLRSVKGGVVLDVIVQPGASRTEWVGPFGEPARLKIRIASPPVDGKANEALVSGLAEFFGCPKRAVELIKGSSSRRKSVLITGFTREQLEGILKKSINTKI